MMSAGPWEDYATPAPSAAPMAPTADDNGPWNDFHPQESSWSGYGRSAWQALQTGLNKLDSYTGAPARAAIYAAQNAPSISQIPSAAFLAAEKQFGVDPSTAPTGQAIVENAGIPKGSTAAKLAGFGMDMASNPLTYVPVGEIAGAGAKYLGGAIGAGAEVAQEAASTVAASKPGLLAKATGTVGQVFTGADKNLAANYAANTDRINQIISRYSGPEGYAAAEHAADIRSNWNDVIQGTRKEMNENISSALNTPAAKQPTIAVKPIQESLQNAIDNAHPVTQADSIPEIKSLQTVLNKMTDANGNMSLYDLHAFKKYAQGIASPTYDIAGNSIFKGGEYAANAANKAAGSARNILIANGPTDISESEAVLSKLHNVEDTMNKSLLKPDGSYAALGRAGTNSGSTEARTLQKLSDITGYNFANDAKDFATSRQFANPTFSPLDTTGKSVWRTGLGMGTGAVAGSLLGVDPKVAGFVGGVMSSPAMLKAGINTANVAGKAVALPFEAAAAMPQAAYSALSSPVGRNAFDVGAKAIMTKSAPQMAEQPSSTPQGVAQSNVNRGPSSPTKGPDAWVQQGIQKLNLNDFNLINRVLSDPKGKQLLIQASDLAPNSAAMKAIMNKIQKGWGQK